jgi:hypothetical protein
MTVETATEPPLVNIWREGRLARRWAHDEAPDFRQGQRLSTWARSR